MVKYEYVCIKGHCPCGHFCVRSHKFKEALENGKVDEFKLILDPWIHQFKPKNHFFLNESSVFEVSKEEMERFVEGSNTS